jgi:hypothetical protein
MMSLPGLAESAIRESGIKAKILDFDIRVVKPTVCQKTVHQTIEGHSMVHMNIHAALHR